MEKAAKSVKKPQVAAKKERPLADDVTAIMQIIADRSNYDRTCALKPCIFLCGHVRDAFGQAVPPEPIYR